MKKVLVFAAVLFAFPLIAGGTKTTEKIEGTTHAEDHHGHAHHKFDAHDDNGAKLKKTKRHRRKNTKYISLFTNENGGKFCESLKPLKKTGTIPTCIDSKALRCKIVLLRQAFSEDDVNNKLLSKGTQSPITERASKKIAKLSKIISKAEPSYDAVFSSPQSLETAKLLSSKVETVNELSEIDYGTLAGKDKDELIDSKEVSAMFADPNCKAPGGSESLKDVYIRTYEALNKIAENNLGKNIIVVLPESIFNILYACLKNSFMDKASFAPIRLIWEPGIPCKTHKYPSNECKNCKEAKVNMLDYCSLTHRHRKKRASSGDAE